MDSIIAEWLSTYESTETKLSYKYDIERLRSWLSANNITFKDITLKDLQRWGWTVGKSPADRRCLSAIKSFLKYCFNQAYLSSDVSRCLKVARRTKIRVERKLSKEEVIRQQREEQQKRAEGLIAKNKAANAGKSADVAPSAGRPKRKR